MPNDLIPSRGGTLALGDWEAATDVRQARRPARRALVRIGGASIVAESALQHIGKLTAEEVELCRTHGPVIDARARMIVDRFTSLAAIEVGGLARWGGPR